MSYVETVAGQIQADLLGRTLMHEHVYINMLREKRPEGLLNNRDLMATELGRFRDAGGSTIVDLTSAELTYGAAPDPAAALEPNADRGVDDPSTRSRSNVAALQDLARQVGVNIIVGTGHYRDPFLDLAWFDKMDATAIADGLVRDIEEGFPGTDVRAGIIGEIGADKWFISAAEERSFRAAARAQLRTGVVLSTHAAKWPVGLEQYDLLTQEGVTPERIIVGHCDTVPIPEYHAELARRGVYVQFDNIRNSTQYELEAKSKYVLNLVHAGAIDQILLSHDVCKMNHLFDRGGGGYQFVLQEFTQQLERLGMDRGEIDHILIDNPRRALGRS